jgi:dTMP kinase
MRRRAGLLIAVEGIDGTGKSTLVRALARTLRSQGATVYTAAEPGKSSHARQALRVGESDPWRAAILFTQDRLIGRVRVERWLRRRCIVIQDRSLWSTIAYQGSRMSPAHRRKLRALQEWVALRPDRTLLLSLSPRTALGRLARRGGPRASMERLSTLRRVDKAYHSLAKEGGWIILDAERPPRDLVRSLAESLNPLLQRRGILPSPRR